MSTFTYAFDDTPQALADKAELEALDAESRTYSLEDLRIELRQQSYDSGEGQSSDESNALIIEDTRQELERRGEVLGVAYPFNLHDGVLTANQNWLDRPAYGLLLLVSALTFDGRRSGIGYFEEAVALALGSYIGGESVRFGTPRTEPVPKNPELAVDYLAQRLREPRSADLPVRSSDKDMGLDAAAWKHFPDRRRGKLILFGQCATGHSWREKIGQPNLFLWRSYVAYRVPPVQVFAIPWIPNDELWETMQAHGALVFDRLRIAAYLPEWQGTKTIIRWCREHIGS